MSYKNEQSQQYNVQSGLALFDSHLIHRTNLDGQEKLNDQIPFRKDSTSSNNSSSSTPTYIKPVGSHRLFAPIKK